MGVGLKGRLGGDICMLMADSHCCITETNKHYKAIILQLKIKKNLKE